MTASTIAGQLDISSGVLVLTVLPHALIELTLWPRLLEMASPVL